MVDSYKEKKHGTQARKHTKGDQSNPPEAATRAYIDLSSVNPDRIHWQREVLATAAANSEEHRHRGQPPHHKGSHASYDAAEAGRPTSPRSAAASSMSSHHCHQGEERPSSGSDPILGSFRYDRGGKSASNPATDSGHTAMNSKSKPHSVGRRHGPARMNHRTTATEAAAAAPDNAYNTCTIGADAHCEGQDDGNTLGKWYLALSVFRLFGLVTYGIVGATWYTARGILRHAKLPMLVALLALGVSVASYAVLMSAVAGPVLGVWNLISRMAFGLTGTRERHVLPVSRPAPGVPSIIIHNADAIQDVILDITSAKAFYDSYFSEVNRVAVGGDTAHQQVSLYTGYNQVRHAVDDKWTAYLGPLLNVVTSAVNDIRRSPSSALAPIGWTARLWGIVLREPNPAVEVVRSRIRAFTALCEDAQSIASQTSLAVAASPKTSQAKPEGGVISLAAPENQKGPQGGRHAIVSLKMLTDDTCKASQEIWHWSVSQRKHILNHVDVSQTVADDDDAVGTDSSAKEQRKAVTIRAKTAGALQRIESTRSQAQLLCTHFRSDVAARAVRRIDLVRQFTTEIDGWMLRAGLLCKRSARLSSWIDDAATAALNLMEDELLAMYEELYAHVTRNFFNTENQPI